MTSTFTDDYSARYKFDHWANTQNCHRRQQNCSASWYSLFCAKSLYRFSDQGRQNCCQGQYQFLSDYFNQHDFDDDGSEIVSTVLFHGEVLSPAMNHQCSVHTSKTILRILLKSAFTALFRNKFHSDLNHYKSRKLYRPTHPVSLLQRE